MNRFILLRGVSWTTCALVVATSSWAALGAVAGQKDDFSNGTTQGWQVGSSGSGGISPVVVLSGGPGGAGDAYMKLTATGGFGPFSKLVVFNQAQWAGSYDGSLDRIDMQLANFGTTSLKMRIAFQDTAFNQYVSTTAFDLPAGSGWQTATWILDADQFFSPTGGDFDAGRLNIREMRLLHSVSGTGLTGDTVSAVVGVDNIQAVAVPEPGIAGLVVCGLLATTRRRWRRA